MAKSRNRAKKYHAERKKKRKLAHDNGTGTETVRVSYNLTKFTKNSLFEEYYRKQCVCSSDEDFQKMTESFIKDLPSTFRVYKQSLFYDQVTQFLKNQQSFFTKSPVKLQNAIFQGPMPIQWCPDAWRVGTDRVSLRKEEVLKPLHNFIVNEAKTENITRQEEVSMLPVTLLDLTPNCKIFDACSSPGSKTSQMLEKLLETDSQLRKGFVIANDNDPKRAYMLHHRLKRYHSPHLLVSCCEAQLFPKFREYFPNGIFNKILCDVPCSSDGTMRKNRDVLKSWNANNGINLHSLQKIIAWRCLELLEKDGLMVYSTCTLNPIEDEAVVADLIRRSNGKVEIVDVGEIEHFKTRKGLSCWKVCTQVAQKSDSKKEERNENDGALIGSSLKEFDNLEDFEKFKDENASNTEIKFAKKMVSSMFPPSEEEAKTMNLDRCMRILPHDNNTGGFFVCLLKKTENFAPNASTAATETEEKVKLESEFSLIQGLDEESFGELDEEFTFKSKADLGFDLSKSLFVRKEPKSKRKKNVEADENKKSRVISYVSPGLLPFITQPCLQNRLNLISCGVPVFKRVDRDREQQHNYRFTNDGLALSTEWLSSETKRQLSMTLEDFHTFCLYSMHVPASDAAKEGKRFCPGAPLDKLNDFNVNDPEINERSVGSYVVSIKDGIKVTLWLSKKSISSLIAEPDLKMIYQHLFPNDQEEKEKRLEELEKYFEEMLEIKKRQQAKLNE